MKNISQARSTGLLRIGCEEIRKWISNALGAFHVRASGECSRATGNSVVRSTRNTTEVLPDTKWISRASELCMRIDACGFVATNEFNEGVFWKEAEFSVAG